MSSSQSSSLSLFLLFRTTEPAVAEVAQTLFDGKFEEVGLTLGIAELPPEKSLKKSSPYGLDEAAVTLRGMGAADSKTATNQQKC